MIRKPSEEVLEKIRKDYYYNDGKVGRIGGKDSVGYIVVNTRTFYKIDINEKHYKRSHIVWFLCKGEWPTQQIDHIDRDSSNDKIENLREVDNFQQQRNKNNYNGYRGFSIEKKMDGKWRYRNLIAISRARGVKLRGYFRDREEGCKAIDAWWEEKGCLVGENWDL